MAMQSIEFTRRQIGRARVTAEAALSGPHAALKAYAPDMIAQCDAYEAADGVARAAEQQVLREVQESDAALAQLRAQFDQVRELAAAKLGVTYEAASMFRTSDDLLNAAEDLEGQVAAAASSGADWAAPVLEPFSEALDRAEKEYQEGSEARKALQKAGLDRARAEGQLRPTLVRFRRLVRVTFGSSSREYRELLDRRGRGSQEPAEEPSGAGQT